MAASVWKGYLSFGLVSFPVRLTTAARPETIHFHLLHEKDLSRLKEVWYCKEEDRPVERDEIVKGYEFEKGQYVVVGSEDLKRIAPPTARTMDILQFVRANEVDPIYLEKSYYVIPEEAVSKPYFLLMNAMTETKYYAIAKVTMHGREHIVVIRPARNGMVLHTMYYSDELHQANRVGSSQKSAFNDKELDLAKRLIDTLASPFKPEQYQDEYRKNVERLVEQKQKGQKITAVKQPRTAPVTNILEALKRSLHRSAQAAGSTRSAAGKKAAKQRRKPAA